MTLKTLYPLAFTKKGPNGTDPIIRKQCFLKQQVQQLIQGENQIRVFRLWIFLNYWETLSNFWITPQPSKSIGIKELEKKNRYTHTLHATSMRCTTHFQNPILSSHPSTKRPRRILLGSYSAGWVSRWDGGCAHECQPKSRQPRCAFTIQKKEVI